MDAKLMHSDGSLEEASTESIRRALGGDRAFWLDIVELDPVGVSWLADLFHIHPLAIEDAENFGQRPKIDAYDDFSQLVIFGAADEPEIGVATNDDSAEVHCLVGGNFLVTVRDSSSSKSMDLIRERASQYRHHEQANSVMLLYRIADCLIDGYFPVMSRFDDAIDDLEEAILAQPTEAQMGQLFQMKRQLVSLRKLVTPERDMFASLLSGSGDLPGMTDEAEHYYRDLYDHLIRLSDLVDSYRDLLTSAVDTHLSTVSNRLNEVMKQLTILATIFLPLSYLTGFFGQNFGWMVVRLTGLPAFLILAIGLELATAVILMHVFRKRGWLGPSRIGAIRHSRADVSPSSS